jgi:hypothetical protein
VKKKEETRNKKEGRKIWRGVLEVVEVAFGLSKPPPLM